MRVSRLRQGRGQTSLETVALMTGTVLALVAVSAYVQRAYAGYLFSSASVHGLPFDPDPATQSYAVSRRLTQFEQTQRIELQTGPSFELFGGDGGSPIPNLPGGPGDLPDAGLPSVPGGSLPPDTTPGRALQVKAHVTNHWDFCNRAAYGPGAVLPAACH